MGKTLFKALGLWFLILLVAILNGVVREAVLVPLLGPLAALPLSGVVLSVLIFALTVVFVRSLDITTAGRAWLVGFFWLALTLAFELVFGHYIMGFSWDDLLATFSPANGNLWLLVLFSALCSPFLAGKTRSVF
jgi:hypothetical protein